MRYSNDDEIVIFAKTIDRLIYSYYVLGYIEGKNKLSKMKTFQEFFSKGGSKK